MSQPQESAGSQRSRPESVLRRVPAWGLVAIAVLGVFSLLIVGLVALVMFSPASNPVSSKSLAVRTMPDGTLLVLEQVTVGKAHRFEHTWSEPERPFNWLLGTAPTRYVEDESTFAEQQMLWLTRRDPKTGQPLDFDWWERCVAIDERGWQIEDENAGRVARTAMGSSSMGGGRPFSPVTPEAHRAIVVHSSLPLFRCDSPTYKLQVFDTSQAVVAEFDVPVPVSAGIPNWAPEQLPVAKSDGELAVTLTALEVQPRGQIAGRTTSRPDVSLNTKLEFFWNGKPSTGWATSDIRLSDALGNTCGPWDCRLNPFESAWKLNYRLYRSNPADLDPSERLELEMIELPPPDTVRSLGQTLTVGPVTLELTAIGMGKVHYTEAVPAHSNSSWGSSGSLGGRGEVFNINQTDKSGIRSLSLDTALPHIRYRLTGLDPAKSQHQLQVQNDQGEALFGSTSSFDHTIILVLPDPRGAKFIKIVASIQAVREVEFFIAPPVEFRAARKTDDDTAK